MTKLIVFNYIYVESDCLARYLAISVTSLRSIINTTPYYISLFFIFVIYVKHSQNYENLDLDNFLTKSFLSTCLCVFFIFRVLYTSKLIFCYIHHFKHWQMHVCLK